MILGYKKRKLSLNLPSDLYEQLKKIALKMDWTEKKTLGWAIALGANVVDKSDEMEKELSELISRKNELNQELESITPDYGKLSSRNAALRYKYFEVFSGNKTLAIKLTGAKTMNGSFKNALKIANRYNEQEDQADIEMVEKYVLK
ncbi:MAG TPA: hypothetical protein VHT73_00640 [Thermodesulfobacteriota bacterium]|nr:hypothetical protein [Thermodesulfobacteriota bacterium]